MSPSLDSLTGFLSWLGHNSLQACLLIGLILALQAALRDRIAPRWRYALWLILVAKLALPWTPPSRWSVYNVLPRPPQSSPQALDSAEDGASLLTSDVTPQGTAWLVEPPAGTVPQPPVAADTPSPVPADATTPLPAAPRLAGSPNGSILLSVLPLVWLAGAAALALLTLAQALRLGGIRRQRLVTDQATLDLLEDCKQQMNVPAYLAVVETPRVSSPALFGFLRPRLLLPVGAIADLGPQRLRHVFLHELAHLKRHDIPVSWLLALLQILHWFNPLVWYAFAKMRADRELACDALALSNAGAPDPREYGRTIVDMLETFVQPRRQPNLAGVLEDKSQLKRRITMIAQFRKPARTWSLPAAALLLLVSVVALSNAQTTQPVLDPPITITAEDVKVVPNSNADLGTYSVVVQLRNYTAKPVKEFHVRFFRGDPAHGGKSLGLHSAGPIEPGKVWNEGTRDLALRDGLNDFTVVVGPADRAIADVPPQHRASVRVRAEDGEIIKTAPQTDTRFSPRRTTNNDRFLNDQQRYFMEGIEKREAAALDASAYTDLSPAARNELITKWLATLKKGQGRPDREQAINGLAAIGDERAVNPLLWIATERPQKDNRERWMATRALGLLGQTHIIPFLIPLTYHYNAETALWAQISLVRLSGRNFGDDWQAWAKWSNSVGQGRWAVVDPHKVVWPGADQAGD